MAGKTTNSTGKTDWLDKHGLTDRERLFVLNFVADPNGSKAAADAGYKSPHVQSCRMLKKDNIKAAIHEGRSQVETEVSMRAEEALAMWSTLARADATELTQNINGPCRYCNGHDHEYQWKTPREFREAYTASCYDLYADPELRDVALRGGITDDRLPNDLGGYGYRVLDDINADCPECGGMGIEVVRMADTRNLSPAALLLFDGVGGNPPRQESKDDRPRSSARPLRQTHRHVRGQVEEETSSPLSRLLQRPSGSAAALPAPPG